MSRREPALERPLAEHGEGGSRPVDALEGLGSEITKHEQIAEQPAGRLGDDHRARLGRTLQPRREIGRVADHRLLLRRAFADEIADHDQPGGDADARLQVPSRPGCAAGPSPAITASPARTARSASSSCACGQPK